MPARFRVGATVENFFNPGAPYTNITVAQITDAYFELQYTDGAQTVARVFPWHTVNQINVTSD